MKESEATIEENTEVKEEKIAKDPEGLAEEDKLAVGAAGEELRESQSPTEGAATSAESVPGDLPTPGDVNQGEATTAADNAADAPVTAEENLESAAAPAE